MNNFLSQLVNKYKHGGFLWKIIFINAGVFILFNVLELFAQLFQQGSIISVTYSLFALPSNLNLLIFRFWTIITYMFTQVGFFHLFVNMLMFYFTGQMLLQIIGEKRLLAVYINGGIIAGLMYILSYNLFPYFNDSVTNSTLIGASGSIMAVFAFVAFYNPNQRVNLFGVISVKIIHLAIAFVVFDYLQLLNSNSGGHLAHIGGFLWGMYSSLQYKKGKDVNNFTVKVINTLFELYYSIKNKNVMSSYGSKTKFKTYKRAEQNKQSKQDDIYNKSKKVQQEIIDQILDKIAAKGYDSLTKEEKAILFNASKKS